MPPHATRERIQKRWFEIRKGKERESVRAENYEELHEEFLQHTDANLLAVVHDFDQERRTGEDETGRLWAPRFAFPCAATHA